MDKAEEEADSLTMFLQFLEKMNGQKPINEAFRNKIESYFEYRWNNDRNSALDDEEELEIFVQLPSKQQDQIYFKFLFADFINKFKYFLIVEKSISFKSINQTSRAFMTQIDRPYTEYVIMLLTKLEPRFEPRHTIIYDELEDVDDMMFVTKGTVLIGYEINKQ